MSADRWQQVDRLFQSAVELEPVRRAAFLDEACAGDSTLRSEIESLLAIDSRRWDFIERPALESAASLLADEQPQLTPGQSIGHYEVLSLIGRGGMGEVYLARDRTLNRKIALKLLPLDYTRDKNRLRRFQREAQAASALNHPNILTIHELGEVDGQQFIATELIEGETLRKHITRGDLSLRNALDVAIQTTSALAAAHKAGIVHRDIKPENIMLRPDGYVKVLDFGLAKLGEEYETTSNLQVADKTDMSSGLMMGTLRYMSPEQTRGKQVDARSDIFSLGVVLYEMAAGRAPFENKNAEWLMESILKDEPPPLTIYQQPDKLAAIVNKTLRKERDTRYQEAEDLLIDLKTLKEELEIESKSLAAEHRSPGRSRTVHVRKERAWSDRAAFTKEVPPFSITTFSSIISEIGRPNRAMAIVILLLSVSVMGYALYRLRRQTRPNSMSVGPTTQTGIWTTKAPISSARYQAEPAVLDGVLYVAGGWNVCTPYSNLESYDPVSNTWTLRAPMLTARGAHGIAVLNGLLYAVGGATGCGVGTANVEAYDPATNTWMAKAPLPTARYGHVVAVANGKLYAIGGAFSNGSGTFAMTTEYNPVTNSWSDRAAMPTPRYSAAAVVVNDIVYVIGGSGSESKTVEAYNPRTNTWASKAPLLTARADFAAAEINGIIYAFGGHRSSDQVDAYNPATDTWARVAQMPAPRTYFHAATLAGSIYFAGGFDGVNYLSSALAFTPDLIRSARPSPCPASSTWTIRTPMPTVRGNMALGEINGILYAVGGEAGAGDAFFAINEAYDPVTDKWTARAPMPTARSMRGTNNAVVNGIFYVIGGNPRGECTNANEAYDPATDTWTTKAPMPTARCHVAVAALGGLVYAIGGNTNTAFTSIVEVYDPTTNAWTKAPAIPTARQEVGAGVIDGILYVVGGLNQNGSLNILEAYDPTSRTWATKASMPTPRNGLAVGILNGSLVVVGGENDGTSVATVEVYDPSSDTWTTQAPMPTARTFLSAVTLNNTMYALGGGNGPAFPGALPTNEAYTTLPCSGQK